MRRTFLLRPNTIPYVLDRHHLSHRRFANHLGLSRSCWSQVFNRHRHLTPDLRQCQLSSRYLQGVDEAQLWDVEERAGEAR